MAQLPNLIVQWGYAKSSLKALDGIMALPIDPASAIGSLRPDSLGGAYQISNAAFACPGQSSAAIEIEALAIAQTEEELAAAQQILTQREDALRAAALTSPADGIVKNVRLTTLGGVLRPGDEVLQIVPTGSALIVEAQVPPRDIAFVALGQRARVNFDAFDNAIYGSGEGKVVYISPDTLSEQREDGSANVYYRVNLEVDTTSLSPREGAAPVNLQPGMTASAEILTGSSTVWEYLTKPILKTVRRSFQER